MEKNFFDMMVQEVLPSVRALMARKLLEHGFSQKQVAEKLGLTQPAISQYKRNLRGLRKDLIEEKPKLGGMVDELARKIASGHVNPRDANLELFEVCKEFFLEA
jgi:predicted transcriptional regulator